MPTVRISTIAYALEQILLRSEKLGFEKILVDHNTSLDDLIRDAQIEADKFETDEIDHYAEEFDYDCPQEDPEKDIYEGDGIGDEDDLPCEHCEGTGWAHGLVPGETYVHDWGESGPAPATYEEIVKQESRVITEDGNEVCLHCGDTTCFGGCVYVCDGCGRDDCYLDCTEEHF